MTTKEWLLRGWKIDSEIEALQELRDEAWSQLTSATQKLDGVAVQGFKNPHKFDRVTELDGKIVKRIDELVGIKQEILTAILQVKDRRYRTILMDRYIRFKTWERIAVDDGYNIRHIWRLHGEALQAITPYTERQKDRGQ